MERYDIRQGEWMAEKAEAGDFVLYADAQATIAALQAERDTARRRVDELEAREVDVVMLREDLAQRTAEFQRHDGELQQICGQALGYPWFKDDQKNFPGATEKDGVCVGEHVGITIAQELANAYRKRTAALEAANHTALTHQALWREACDQRDKAQAELKRVRGELAHAKKMEAVQKEVADNQTWHVQKLRTLIAALPKVEGEIEVSSGVYNFILLKHDSGTGFLCGQIETEQTARAIAALLKHRQGMEGV